MDALSTNSPIAAIFINSFSSISYAFYFFTEGLPIVNVPVLSKAMTLIEPKFFHYFSTFN